MFLISWQLAVYTVNTGDNSIEIVYKINIYTYISVSALILSLSVKDNITLIVLH